MPERLPCLVPFCRRTRPNDGTFSEWICGPHWRGVPAKLKAIHRRARAAKVRADALDRSAFERLVGTPNWHLISETDPLVRERLAAAWTGVLATNRACRVWAICKRRAIEAACGISGAMPFDRSARDPRCARRTGPDGERARPVLMETIE